MIEVLDFVLGGGTLFVLQLTPDGALVELSTSQWPDGLFDVVWSEADPNIVVTASGDGVLQLWNISCPQVLLYSCFKISEKFF